MGKPKLLPNIPSIPTDDPWELRRIYNEGLFEERAAKGELKFVPWDSRPAPSNITGWVPGTTSETLYLLDADDHIHAKVHGFFRPDRTLAGSGKLDPKRVLHEGSYRTLKLPTPTR